MPEETLQTKKKSGGIKDNVVDADIVPITRSNMEQVITSKDEEPVLDYARHSDQQQCFPKPQDQCRSFFFFLLNPLEFT